jgi:hypothetical protein
VLCAIVHMFNNYVGLILHGICVAVMPGCCAGYRVGQLLRAGYSTAELVQSSSPELRHLRAAGIR